MDSIPQSLEVSKPSLSSNPLQPSTTITPSKREKGNMRFVELNWVLFFWVYVLLVQHLCELRETNTTFLLLSAQIYCWFFCLICYIFANVVRSFEYRIQILIFTKPSIFEIVLSCFCMCFFVLGRERHKIGTKLHI